MPRDAQDTRDRVIARHVQIAMAHAPMSMEAFAEDVMRLYHERTAEHLRGLQFHHHRRGTDAYAVLRANAQIVRRLLEGQVRMPVELEEALVFALPPAFRDRCIEDLAQRFGLLGARRPSTDPTGQTVQLGELLREFGEAVEALAPVFADGVLDETDAAAARRAIREVDDLRARATTLIAMLETVVRPVQMPTVGKQ